MDDPSRRPKKGRPSDKDLLLWELEVGRLETRELFERIGPALRRLQLCPDHKGESTSVASGLARFARQAYARRL
jgi:hypothetical protein